MKGQFIAVDDGYAIVGYHYECPKCKLVTLYVVEAECEKCGFKEEGEPE